MNLRDPLLTAQLPAIRKIIADETWLEGERRRQPVSSEDPVVVAHVCDIIVRVSPQLREAAALQVGNQAA